MITLYINGFRGFEETYLPLRNVSFFVGENSTGKTSVLAAIQILSEPTYWLTGHFRSEEVSLGGFRDIASPGQSHFQIGFFSSTRAVLLTFTSKKGLPVLSSLRLLNEAVQLKLFQKDQDVFIDERPGRKHSKTTKKPRGDKTFKDTFKTWLKEDPFDPTGTNKVSTKDFPEDTSLAVALALARNTSIKRALKRESKSFTVQFLAPQRLLNGPVWIAPIRAKPRRTYDTPGYEYSSEGEHLPQLLNTMLGLETSSEGKQVLEYGSASGLFKKVGIHRFGEEENSPIEITVDLDGLTTSIFNVGYGVSQSLPVVGEIVSRPKRTWFAIQQPEVHLHPRAQATLGELIFNMAVPSQGKRFLVETHSDYIIDRFRSSMRKAKQSGRTVPTAQVIFFRREAGRNTLHSLPLSPLGDYPEKQPDGFRSFFLQEELRNLGF